MYNTDLPQRAELPSTAKLLRSTALAALIAGALLVTTVLPAEYGIDPTGVGRALGLTPMGEIKRALANEARTGGPSGVAQAQPAPIAMPAAPAEPARSSVSAKEAAPSREHTVTIKLKPGAAAEIKLAMRKDSTVNYEWTAVGGGVNYDTHGDPVEAPKGFYHGYGKGRNETAQAGALRAAFDGKHGWFWRNRSGAEVTVTLKTSGEYGQIERVL